MSLSADRIFVLSVKQNRGNALYENFMDIKSAYICSNMCAIVSKNLSSEIGFKGLFRKVLIFMLVGIANVVDMQIIGAGSALKIAVVFFYLSNEGISILENAAFLGVPIPEELKRVLKQIKHHDKDRKGKK